MRTAPGPYNTDENDAQYRSPSSDRLETPSEYSPILSATCRAAGSERTEPRIEVAPVKGFNRCCSCRGFHVESAYVVEREFRWSWHQRDCLGALSRALLVSRRKKRLLLTLGERCVGAVLGSVEARTPMRLVELVTGLAALCCCIRLAGYQCQRSKSGVVQAATPQSRNKCPVREGQVLTRQLEHRDWQSRHCHSQFDMLYNPGPGRGERCER